ncbi:hypothetical protein Tco_1485073 [Tanacetum coccineum]
MSPGKVERENLPPGYSLIILVKLKTKLSRATCRPGNSPHTLTKKSIRIGATSDGFLSFSDLSRATNVAREKFVARSSFSCSEFPIETLKHPLFIQTKTPKSPVKRREQMPDGGLYAHLSATHFGFSMGSLQSHLTTEDPLSSNIESDLQSLVIKVKSAWETMFSTLAPIR